MKLHRHNGRIQLLIASLLLSVLALCTIAYGQDKKDEKSVPQPVPANVLLAEHSNWFTPAKIYDLQQEHYPLNNYPQNLSYKVYSAVGYDLANTMVVLGPNTDKNGNREIIIIDTLGNPGITGDVINEFRKAGIFPQSGKLPIRAIIYTHNHIDHTAGVDGYLKEADRPPCQPANPNKAGPDDYVNEDTDHPNCVSIIGQYKINDGVGTTALVSGTIIDARSLYMYGSVIPLNHVNDGIGPQEKSKPGYQPGYRMPSRTFDNELLMTAAGINMKIIYVPSETNDELSVFLPDSANNTNINMNPGRDTASRINAGGPGLLFSAEVIQGPSFPNLYSLRGTTYRNPADWFRSVDKLRQFDSWCMVPSHGPPLCEPANIQKLLKNFRDAIQFTHDQTVRFMNKGYTMNELAPLIEGLYLENGEHDYIMKELASVRAIKNQNVPNNKCPDSGTPLVPPHQPTPPDRGCVNPEDYLRPFYGSLVQAVREIYVGSVGWFQGDPVDLRPTPPKPLAQRTIAMMCSPDPAKKGAMVCGADGVNIAAEEALKKREYEWAAELATKVIWAYADPNGIDKSIPVVPALSKAKEIKAQAFIKLGEGEMNPNWRNFYLTAANELQGKFIPSEIKGGLVSPSTVAGLPAGAWVNSLTMRLKAELTAKDGTEKSIGFWFPAAGDQGFGALGYVLKIRHGIAEFIENLSEPEVASADLAISINKETLNELIIAESKGQSEVDAVLDRAIKAGTIKPLHGTLAEFNAAFHLYFEPKPVGVPALAGR